MKEKITRSSGNVFTDLGFPPEEVAILSMRADLMTQLHPAIEQDVPRSQVVRPPLVQLPKTHYL